jgi:hypothetical protein
MIEFIAIFFSDMLFKSDRLTKMTDHGREMIRSVRLVYSFMIEFVSPSNKGFVIIVLYLLSVDFRPKTIDT